MRRRPAIIAGTSLLVVCASLVAIVGGVAAYGAPAARPAAQLIEPAVTSGDDHFYTDEQIDGVWRAVVANFAAPLPSGYSFPKDAPEFFHPKDDEAHIFQSGLPDLIAARYWRCYWLDASVEAKGAGDAKALSSATEALSAYQELPSVSRLIDVEKYEGQMAEIAAAMGTDVASAELEVECGGITK